MELKQEFTRQELTELYNISSKENLIDKLINCHEKIKELEVKLNMHVVGVTLQTKEEQEIIESTKEFAEANNIHYDTMTQNMILNAMRSIIVSNPLATEKYEPYFGWCDVYGCENEGCSGGNAWRDSGYWTVCCKHSTDYRSGLNQPKMKQASVDRENKREIN